MKQLKSISKIKFKKDQVVLVRVNLDLPLVKNKLGPGGDFRLLRSLPTIKYLLKQRVKVVLISHRGRPDGKKIKDLSLKVLQPIVSRALKLPVEFIPELSALKRTKLIQSKARVFLLENIRFYPGEDKNSLALATSLAQVADFYVNDDFATSHRKTASMVAITRLLPSVAGFNLCQEVENLSCVLNGRGGSRICLMGGAKVGTKLPVIKNLWSRFDKFIFLGGIANSYLAAIGKNPSSWLVDKKYFPALRKLNTKKIYCPEAYLVSQDLNFSSHKNFKVTKKNIAQITVQDLILDLDTSQVEPIIKILKSADLIVWNGAPGYFENKITSTGSYWLAKELAKSKAMVVAGGGETVEILSHLKLLEKIKFVSTGGGAMLEFLAGEKLPAIEVLRK